MLELEYDPRQTKVRLGKLVLHDETCKGALHRQAVSFKISGELYETDKDFINKCDPNIIGMIYKGSSLTLEDVFEIPAEVQVGPLIVELILDMSHLKPVYAETSFKLDMVVKVILHGEDQDEVEHPASCNFLIHENRQTCLLHLTFKDERKDSPPVRWEFPDSDNPPISIDLTEIPVFQGTGGHSNLLTLFLRNTASIPNGNPCKNYLTIRKISLNSDSEDLDLSELLSFVIDKHRVKTCTWSRGRELKPGNGPENELALTLAVSIGADSAFFQGDGDTLHRRYRISLCIDYELPGENGEVVERSCLIPIHFELQEDFSNDVVAVDYGTSAISMARSFPGNDMENHYQLIPLKKIWQRHNPFKEPLEQDENSIASILLYSTSGEFPMVVLPSREQFKVQSTAHHPIPFLKSYIGGCKKDIDIDSLRLGIMSGEKINTRVLLLEVYKLLYKDYILDGRQDSQYRRMVIAHPNSYMDGQIHFLKSAIREALPDVRDVQAMSESDAVIYAYLRNEDVAGKDQFELRMKSQVEPSDTEKFEHVLCFDIGAGTVDISYRRIHYLIQHDSVSGTSLYPDLSVGNKHDLLGMVSLNGAGNALDEVLASIVNDLLIRLRDNVVPSMEVNPEEYGFTPCMKAVEDGNWKAQFAQLQSLLSLKGTIGDAKCALPCQSDRMEIELPISTSFQEKSGIIIASNQNSLLQLVNKSQEIDVDGDISLLFREDRCFISISMKHIQKQLQKDFFPRQVNEPIEIVLGSEKKAQVDTVLISGRAALFPGVMDQIRSEIQARCSGEPVFIAMGDSGKMKSLVVEGALRWGVDNTRNEVLFRPPRLFGVLGAAWRINGQWFWKTLVTSDQIQQDLDILMRQSPSLIINPNVCRGLMILHSSIIDDVVISDKIKSLIGNIHVIGEAQAILERGGYFRVLRSIGDIFRFRVLGSEVPLSILPLFPENGAYGDWNPREDYPNVRIRIKIGNDELEDKNIALHQAMTFYQFWPHNIFSPGEIK